jgi:hypothetical protein
MPLEDPSDLPGVDREIRRNELEHLRRSLGDEATRFWVDDDEPLDAGDLWDELDDVDSPAEGSEGDLDGLEDLDLPGVLHAHDVEDDARGIYAPVDKEDEAVLPPELWISHRRLLQRRGVDLPPPEMLADAQLPGKLHEILHALAADHTYLLHTDHLSDRELYEDLWYDTLDEAMPALPAHFATAGNCIIDMVGSGSDEDMRIYLTYYADEEERRHWRLDWPGDDVPPHRDPPHRRDRTLPRPPEGI